jgi:hypothetical protein
MLPHTLESLLSARRKALLSGRFTARPAAALVRACKCSKAAARFRNSHSGSVDLIIAASDSLTSWFARQALAQYHNAC